MIARSVAAARSLAGGPRTAPSPFPLALRRGDQPAIFGTDGGRTHAIVATVSRDVLEASPESRRRLAERFEDLLASLDAGLQILVQSRPTDFAAVADPELRRRLLRLPGPRLERRVSLVLTDTPAGIDRLRALLGRRGAAPPDEDGALAPPDAARLLAAAETLAAQLTAMGLAGEVLRGRALDRHLDAALPPIVARPGAAARWAEHPGHLDLDGEISRSYRLDAFPGAELDVGWLGALVDLPFPYDLAIHAELLPAPAVLRLLNRRIRDLEASHLGGATADPLVEAGLPDARGLRREVAANQRAALAVSVCLTVLAASPEEAAERGRMVEDAASRCLATMLPATFQMAAGRLATLPLGTDPLDRPHVLPADAAATLYPWTWEDLVQPAGHLVGVDLRSGAPVVLDTFDAGRLANANIGVYGHSGAGKTHLVRRLLRADAERGIGALVIDPEAEYRDLCEEVGGQWVDLALGSGHSVNVLDADLAALGERDPAGDQASDLLDLLGAMCGALSEDERADVDEALGPLLGTPGATLAALRADLDRRDLAPRVARGLRRWTQGQLGQMFAAPSNVDLRSPFTVFGLRDVKEEFLPVVYFVIAQWIWCRVRAERRQRRLVFDEVGLLVEHDLVRRFLVRLARRVRKYDGSLCLVTQNAGDLLASDQGLVLATNPSTLLLGAQRQAEALRMQRAYGLTDSQVAFLASARRGQFLLLAGDSRHRLRVLG